jgi:hypothetical protein
MGYIRLVELAFVLAMLCGSTAFAQCGPNSIVGKWLVGLGVYEFKADNTVNWQNPGAGPATNYGTWTQTGETYTVTNKNSKVFTLRISDDCQQLIEYDQDQKKDVIWGHRESTTSKPEGGPCTNACDKSKHLVWDGYVGCNCICEDGYKFDEHGNCEPSEVSEFESELLLESQGTTQTIKAGDEIKVPPDGDAKLRLKCKNLQDQIMLLDLLRDTKAWNPYSPGMWLGSPVIDLIIQIKSLNSKCAELGIPLEIKGVNQKDSMLRTMSSDAIGLPVADASDSAVQLSLGLKQGPLRVEVPNDQLSLNVETPVTVVTSAGKNVFGVAYDPNSGKSFVAAYQNPILIQPMNSNQAPFTLGSGQQVEVNSNGIGPITTIGQPTGGSTYVSPNGKDIYGPTSSSGEDISGQTSGMSGGCYQDPSTGEITCVDASGNPTNLGSGRGNPQAQQGPSSGGCYRDPMTGTITCVDSNGNVVNTNSGESNQGSSDLGGCHTDTATGQTICVETVA